MSKRVTKLPTAMVTKHHLVFAKNVSNQLIISRYRDQVAWPILDGGNDANMRLEVRMFDSLTAEELNQLNWTRDIPLEQKNQHRSFWGLRQLRPTGRVSQSR